jgi:hypothetical protein
MANLKDIDSLIVGHPELRQKFRAGRIKAAWFVANESSATEHHVLRKAWAYKIITNYEADLDFEYRWFCSNATIQANPSEATDSDIEYVVASFINQWAGV